MKDVIQAAYGADRRGGVVYRSQKPSRRCCERVASRKAMRWRSRAWRVCWPRKRRGT